MSGERENVRTSERLPVSAFRCATFPRSHALDLSIIIVNWNTRDLLADCLQSVYDTVHDLTFEVFVVDNASSDGSAAMVRERFPDVRLIENAENVGFARANNQAIAQSQGEYVLLLNSDTVLLPGAVHGLIEYLQGQSGIGAVGPTMLNPDGTLQNSYGRLPALLDEILGPYLLDSFTKPWGAHRWHSAETYSSSASPKVVDRVSFACVLICRETLIDVGTLDESYWLYSEDYDWFLRVKRAGWRVVHIPSASVVHHWGGSSQHRPLWASCMLYRAKLIYFRKHYGSVSEFVLRLGLSARFAVKTLLQLLGMLRKRHGGSSSPCQYWDLLKDLWGPSRLERDVDR